MDAYESAKAGNWGWAAVNGAPALTDLTGVGAIGKGIAVGGFKLASKGLLREVYKDGLSMTWKNVRKRLVRRGLVEKEAPVHHWLLNQSQGIGRKLDDWFGEAIANRIRSHPANLMPGIDDVEHALAHQGTWFDYAWYGTPTWAKVGAAGVTSYSTGLVVDADTGSD